MWHGSTICDGHPAEYHAAKVWLTPTAGVPCNNAANIRERKTSTQSELCT